MSVSDFFYRPTNRENDNAINRGVLNGPVVGNRKLSVTGDQNRGSSMMDKANNSRINSNYSTALVDGGKK